MDSKGQEKDMAQTQTRKSLTALAGMYYRLDTGQSGTRNHEATSRALDAHWNALRKALEDGGYEELDANPKLAAKYSKLERRHLLVAR